MTNTNIDTAFIFAAGFGERMLPITLHTPKPMVGVLGKKVIEYCFENINRARFIKNVVVNTHHLAEVIEPYLVACGYPNFKIKISAEKEILETAGGIINALQLIGPKPFFTINGDIIWQDKIGNILEKLKDNFDETKDDILMLLVPKEKAIGYHGKGDFSLKDDGAIYKSEDNKYVYTGIQIIKPRLFFGYEVKPMSLRVIYEAKKQSDGCYKSIRGLVYDGTWLHVGTVADIAKAEEFLLQL